MDKETRSALRSDLVDAGFGEESLLELNDSQLQNAYKKEMAKSESERERMNREHTENKLKILNRKIKEQEKIDQYSKRTLRYGTTR